MRKYSYSVYIVLSLSLFMVSFACNKKDPDFFAGKTPTERSSEAVNQYETLITSASEGWKAVLYPKDGGIFLFSIKFGANNRVTMLSDIDSAKSIMPQESNYSVQALQLPTLLFDTYSYIHLPADPEVGALSGVVGKGYSSDIEYTLDTVKGDTIKLLGVRNQSRLLLVKAASPDEYKSYPLGTENLFKAFYALRTYFKRANIGGVDCDIKIGKDHDISTGTDSKMVNISYVDAGQTMKTVSSAYYVDGISNKVMLSTPLMIGNMSIESLSLTGDKSAHTATLTTNNVAVQVQEAKEPLVYDKTVAKAFHDQPSNGNRTWISNTGFTIDNVIDAYKIRTIPNFRFFVYRLYTLDPNPDKYDRLGFFTTQGYSAQDPAVTTLYPANGRIVFNHTGLVYTAGVPSDSYAPIVAATANKFYDPNGYYVIPTSPTTYDLVNATDARAWISFY